MWVNSKQAAEILGVKYDALQKATRRSEKSGKKFCTIKFHKLYFEYINGRGGASGKTLQIWIDDAVTNDDPSKKEPDDEKNSINANLDHSRGSDSADFCSAVDSAVSD